MKEIKVSSRYAKALFELAHEMKVEDRIRKDAELIASVCAQNREFDLMLRSPVIKELKKMAILKAVFEKSLHEITFKFMMIITRNNRESLIREIAEQYIVIYKKYNNILTAALATAVPISADVREKIMLQLVDHDKSKIELTEDLNESLIGGFVLSFGDNQYDASILRKIKNLHKEFDINLYEKGF